MAIVKELKKEYIASQDCNLIVNKGEPHQANVIMSFGAAIRVDMPAFLWARSWLPL